MTGDQVPSTSKERTLGIVVLTLAQFMIGIMHAFFGFLLLFAGFHATSSVFAQLPEIYSVYTLVFGLLTLIFAYGIWLGRRWGWNGTVAVSVFVVVADVLAVLNLPSIPGIPRFAAVTEIIYSLIVLVYLSQARVRVKFK